MPKSDPPHVAPMTKSKIRIERDDSSLDYDLRYDVQLPFLSAYTGGHNNHNNDGTAAGKGFKIPALGLVWTSVVDLRIALRRISPRDTGSSDYDAADEDELPGGDGVRKRRKIDTKEYQGMQGWLVSYTPPWLKNSNVGSDGAAQRGGGGGAAAAEQRVPLRELSLVFAPHRPPGKLNFVVVKQGVFGTP